MSVRKILIVLLAVAGTLVTTGAWAQSCTIGTNTVAFGVYDPLALPPLDTASQISVSCTRNGGFPFVIYRIDLNTGQAGAFIPRAMTNGASQLNYNLFTNAARSNIWGNGSGATDPVFGFMFIPNGQTRTRRHNVYGRSFAGQTVSTGSYLDTITATVTF